MDTVFHPYDGDNPAPEWSCDTFIFISGGDAISVDGGVVNTCD